MKTLRSTLLMLSITSLAACGGDTEGTNPGASGPVASTTKAQVASPEVVFKVSGADEAEVEGNISIFCTSASGSYDAYLEIGYITSRTNLELVLPLGVSGTIGLIGSRDQGAERGKQNLVHFRGENLAKYVKGSGQLDIQSMPAARGDRFIATMNAELRDKNDNAINIEATFDADAGYQSFDECP